MTLLPLISLHFVRPNFALIADLPTPTEVPAVEYGELMVLANLKKTTFLPIFFINGVQKSNRFFNFQIDCPGAKNIKYSDIPSTSDILNVFIAEKKRKKRKRENE